MTVNVLVDVLILMPVVAFVLWLYWYSAPAYRSRRQRWIDVGLAVAACLAGIAIFSALHVGLEMDGMDRSIIAVAVAYLVFITGMGLAWWIRWRLHRQDVD